MVPAPFQVGPEGEQTKGRCRKAIPVGNPRHAHPVGIIHRIQKGGQPGGPEGSHQSPIEQADDKNEQTVPGHIVEVHQPGLAGEKMEIHPMGERGEGTPEGDFPVRIPPPREHSQLHRLLDRLRIPFRKGKGIQAGFRRPRYAGIARDHAADEVVVCRKPAEEAGQGQQYPGRHRPPKDAAIGQEASQRGREAAGFVG